MDAKLPKLDSDGKEEDNATPTKSLSMNAYALVTSSPLLPQFYINYRPVPSVPHSEVSIKGVSL